MVKTTSTIRKEINEKCQPLTEAENLKFTKWFNNKKTSHERKIQRQAGRSKINALTSSVSDAQILAETKSISDGISEITLEEKMKAQNQDVFLSQASMFMQQLTQLPNEEKKLEYLKNQLEVGFLVILRILSTCHEAPSGSLPLFLQVCKELKDSERQTLFFIRLCGLYQKEILSVPKDLVKNAFVELSSKTNDQQAAAGLLRLSYYNNISFRSFPSDSLRSFEEKYSNAFTKFFTHLNYVHKIDTYITNLFPLTCSLFSKPFYVVFSDQCSFLIENVDPIYLVQFITLLAHSFEGSYEIFLEFKKIFSRLCEKVYNKLELFPLLERIIVKEKEQDRMFYGALTNTTKVMKQLFELWTEEKVDRLDEQVLQDLLDLKDEIYQRQKRQPRITVSVEELTKVLSRYWQKFQEENIQIPTVLSFPVISEDPVLAKLCALFKIQCLNATQMLSFILMEELLFSHRLFQRFTTGSGKTTFSLIWVLYLWLKHKISSVIAYDSNDLCVRDYERLYQAAACLNLSIVLICKEEHLEMWQKPHIVFIDVAMLQKLATKEGIHHQTAGMHLLLDEFDAILFDGKQLAARAKLFLRFKYLTAFTGSPLEEIHQNIIEQGIGGLLLKYPSLEFLQGNTNICQGVSVYNTRPKQIEAIIDICSQQIDKTPVAIITDKTGYSTLERAANGKGLLIKNLATAEPENIKAFLQNVMTASHNGKYYAVILSVNQGRGLDILSTAAIEKMGGFYITIASPPENRRQFEQFKGRTCRMGGKGQHSVVLWDTKYKGDGQCYLNTILATASSLEIQRLSKEYMHMKPSQEEQRVIEEDKGQEAFQIDGAQLQDAPLDQNGIGVEQLLPSEYRHPDIVSCIEKELSSYKSISQQSNIPQHAQEAKILKECQPLIEKEYTSLLLSDKDYHNKDFLITADSDQKLIGKRVRGGVQFGMLTDAEDNDFMEVEKPYNNVDIKPPTKKRTTKAKGKKLSINEQPTDKISSKRTKKEETLEEGVEGNSQKINSSPGVEGD